MIRQYLFLQSVDVQYVTSSTVSVQAYGVSTKMGGEKELVLEYCDQPNWGPHYFRAT
jgi:hypothetical protein